MLKVTILYGQPVSPEAFEAYYSGTHMPIASRMKVAKVELTKFLPGADGTKPPFYRMAELYFVDEAQMQQSMGSPEGQAAVADLPNFATGGITVAVGTVVDPQAA